MTLLDSEDLGNATKAGLLLVKMCVMSLADEELEEALALFASDDEDVALAAFDVLIDRGKRFLEGCLRKRGIPHNEAQDITQIVLLKLWKMQPRFRNEGQDGFYGLLQRLALTTSIDNRQPQWIELDKVVIKVFPNWEDLLERQRLMDLIQLAASNAWMGYDWDLTMAQRQQRLLAAQIFYLEKKSWEFAMEVAGGPKDKKVFKAWVCDPAVILDLCFEELNQSGSTLVKHLLRLPETTSEEELSAIYQESVRKDPNAAGPWGFRQAEVAAIFWKYYSGDLGATIRAQARVIFGPELDDAQLLSLFARCNADLPFLQIIEMLIRALSNDTVSLLKGKGLWQRLVFDLRHLRELPLNDVVDRLAPPAAVVGLEIDLDLLTSWIGNKVLIKKLRACLLEMGGLQ